MSNFQALMVLVALGTGNTFLMVYIRMWVGNLSEGIASGGFPPATPQSPPPSAPQTPADNAVRNGPPQPIVDK